MLEMKIGKLGEQSYKHQIEEMMKDLKEKINDTPVRGTIKDDERYDILCDVWDYLDICLEQLKIYDKGMKNENW